MPEEWIKGDWMQTASGKKFYPFAPEPADIDIEDIAHALAMTNRYGGHTKFPYSVAQHSVLVASKAPPHLALAALLHDAAEAYIGDLIYPVKKHDSMCAFSNLERTLEMAIAAKFDLPWPFITDEIKALDFAILADEKAQLMTPGPDWHHVGEPLGVKILPWTWDKARLAFLNAFQEYEKWTDMFR